MMLIKLIVNDIHFWSNTVSIIIQKDTLCTSKNRVIYFFPNCVIFLPENVPSARTPMI